METTPENVITGPEAILQLGIAFQGSKTLLSAVELALFTMLAEAPATEAEVRERLALHPRASRDFLDALVALGILEREDDRYRNSPAADVYLDRRKPSYLGGFLELANNALYPSWGRLTEALRTGEPPMEGWASEDPFGDLYEDPDGLRDFMASMDAQTRVLGPALAHSVGWSGYDSFLDVGGARGNLAAELVKAHPHLRGGCFDLPQVEPLFDEHMARLGLRGRVRFHAGDFFVDSLPEADVLIFGHVLHDWDVSKRQALIEKGLQAIRPGGALLVYDTMIDDDRRGKPLSLLRSLNMLLVTTGGSEYTAADCCSWLEQAGFGSTSAMPIASTETLVIARKDP